MKERMLVVVAVLTLSLIGTSVVARGGEDGVRVIRGGATTMLEGGTGAPEFVPVLTKLAFHWNGTKGDMECLAIAPSDPAGDPGSGDSTPT